MLLPLSSHLRCAVRVSVLRTRAVSSATLSSPSPLASLRDQNSCHLIRNFTNYYFYRGFRTSLLLRHNKDLYSISLLDRQKKYFIDLKQGKDKYVKISEVTQGKRATMMVDLEDLSMFTAKLMVAEGGETVGTLKSGLKSYDFSKVSTIEGSFVVVTENSTKKYRVFLTCEIVPEVIKHLIVISEKYSEPETGTE